MPEQNTPAAQEPELSSQSRKPVMRDCAVGERDIDRDQVRVPGCEPQTRPGGYMDY